jgi:hypothetical protein
MEEIDVDYDGEPLAVRFNARYLLDVLAKESVERRPDKWPFAAGFDVDLARTMMSFMPLPRACVADPA